MTRVADRLVAGCGDWRIWAVAVILQVPSLRAAAKFMPSHPIGITAGLVLATAGLLILVLHTPAAREFLRRAGSPPAIAALVVCIAIASAIAYPRADARKAIGGGSDEDDALIETSRRVNAGEHPFYTKTDLGNGVSAGAPWAVILAPIARDPRTYFLLAPIGLAVLAWSVATAAGAEGAALAVLLPLVSVWWWELLSAGSDLPTAGAAFVAATLLVRARWMRSVPITIATAVLVSAAASARIVFAFVPLVLALFLWVRHRRGAGFLAFVAMAVTTAVVVDCWPDPDSRTPLHLLAKGLGLVGSSGLAAVAAATAAAVLLAALRVRRDDSEAAWLGGVATVLLVPLGIVGAVELAAYGAQGWPGPNALAVVIAPAVAAFAISLTR